MELSQELVRVWQRCQQIKLGDHQVFFNENPTPAHEYHSVIKVLDFQRAIELTARDSYDATLAKQLLDQTERVSPEHYREPGLSIFEHQFAHPYTFSSVVFAPPSIAKRFATRSELLNANTGWFFPAYRGEFVDGESSSDFWHQIGRKDDHQIHIVRWDRQPDWTRVQSYSTPKR